MHGWYRTYLENVEIVPGPIVKLNIQQFATIIELFHQDLATLKVSTCIIATLGVSRFVTYLIEAKLP